MAKELPLPPETHAMKTERLFIPSVSYSLVESVCGDNYPEEDGPPVLVSWVRNMQGLYSTFLGKLIAGSSFRAACMAIALSPQTLTRWLQQGSADVADDLDTYCGRLMLDVQRAAALAVGDAEERVHKSDPTKWLGRGPAKDFHKGRYWNEAITNQAIETESQQEDNPIDPLPLRPVEQLESEADTTETELEEAMKVLEGHQILQDPKFIEQARNQYRIQKEDK